MGVADQRKSLLSQGKTSSTVKAHMSSSDSNQEKAVRRDQLRTYSGRKDSHDSSYGRSHHANSFDIEHLLGKDDWAFAEGLLTIYLRGKNQHRIVFQDDEVSKRSKHSTNNPQSFRPRKQILDLGSCKETISLFESSDYHH